MLPGNRWDEEGKTTHVKQMKTVSIFPQIDPHVVIHKKIEKH
ncbi:hypothetical protein HBHAL_3841 [Halobacillus halophilus DSM 2266]|uniref:Uncharacterized protein n=1 Tax=Halobacillus halophilus (strain ATCC 35676 / DSM 2266 / JCM 20832 / KCTC 3685 / LMG 17431 / NBRC 102448 / NCIMB 2269) TaxID=866895 RepID=I0JPW5_HALH3|nr:hypothetical protein HBHAL_3841 [Halobacillus halophilus DSM 2266]